MPLDAARSYLADAAEAEEAEEAEDAEEAEMPTRLLHLRR